MPMPFHTGGIPSRSVEAAATVGFSLVEARSSCNAAASLEQNQLNLGARMTDSDSPTQIQAGS
jgi:hypothetical protein